MSNKKRVIFKGVSLALAIILTLCPISLCYSANATEVVIDDLIAEEVVNLIYETLIGWGIKVIDNLHPNEFNEVVRQWVLTELFDHLSAIEAEWDEWVTDWKITTDTFGRTILNNNGLLRIQQFANYLITKFSLQSNSTYTLGEYFVSNGITLYKFPFYAIRYYNGTDREAIFRMTSNSVTDTSNVYGIIFDNPTNFNDARNGMLLINPTSITIGVNAEEISSGSNFYQGTESFSQTEFYGHDFSPWYHAVLMSSHPVNYYRFIGESYSLDYIEDTLTTNINEVNVGGITQTIELPSQNPDYQSGYSIIYYPDGNVGYLDIDWPESVAVNNLPAIVSTGRIANLDVSSITLPFSGFISMMSDGLELMTDIIYNFPTPIITFALAIISATIVFGVIKVLKEH